METHRDLDVDASSNAHSTFGGLCGHLEPHWDLEDEQRKKHEVICNKDEGSVHNPGVLAFSLTKRSAPKLSAWLPERAHFWRAEGHAIAWRNLLVSQINLTLGFAVWLMWSILAVRIQQIHDHDPTQFTFGLDSLSTGGETHDETLRVKYNAMLYLLPALAGLAGGAFRLTNSFMVLSTGGRVAIVSTTLMLILPCGLASVELQKPDPDLLTLAAAAMLSGMGGGAFASSMSNISTFFPARIDGFPLGLNAGLGNMGVSLSQVLIPLVTGGYICASTECDYINMADVAHLREQLHRGALLWTPFCIIAAVAGYLWLSDMPQQGNAPLRWRMYYYFCLQASACGAAVVAGIVLFSSENFFSVSPQRQIGKVFLLVCTVCVLAHVFLWFASPQAIQQQIRSQMIIFRNRHTYLMVWLYMVCFGTYIGFSSALPKLMLDVFGYVGEGDAVRVNPNAPQVSIYSFLGPFLGSLVRPMGGWLSDKFGAAIVTQTYVGVLCGSALGLSLVIRKARESQKPEEYFSVFLSLFLLLFTASGIANGSTFKQMSQVFRVWVGVWVCGWYVIYVYI
jgi:NNP family nitrate/nitrite transporter-like MFS transporter